MLKRKYFFIYKYIPIPSFLVAEGYQYSRFKTFFELKQDFLFFYKKIIALLKKESIKYNCNSFIIKSSFDSQIKEKGGIVDCDGNIHTTAQSYKNYLKDNDLVIKDWSDGSNKPRQQLSDRAEIAKIVNKYLN